jgi:hypothetical protein
MEQKEGGLYFIATVLMTLNWILSIFRANVLDVHDIQWRVYGTFETVAQVCTETELTDKFYYYFCRTGSKT